MANKPTLNNSPNNGLPPFVRSWPQLYGFVVANLLLTVVLFYVIKQYFK